MRRRRDERAVQSEVEQLVEEDAATLSGCLVQLGFGRDPRLGAGQPARPRRLGQPGRFGRRDTSGASVGLGWCRRVPRRRIGFDCPKPLWSLAAAELRPDPAGA